MKETQDSHPQKKEIEGKMIFDQNLHMQGITANDGSFDYEVPKAANDIVLVIKPQKRK